WTAAFVLLGVYPEVEQLRYRLCPFPVLFSPRWFFPIIGHMGICTSTGVIRDFAGPYFVSDRPGGQCGQKNS
uniref:Uncharacterized protein n=1 Tax=Sus scrofa TaxID=9823 RepID=A0A8D1K7Z7_PIG